MFYFCCPNHLKPWTQPFFFCDEPTPKISIPSYIFLVELANIDHLLALAHYPHPSLPTIPIHTQAQAMVQALLIIPLPLLLRHHLFHTSLAFWPW